MEQSDMSDIDDDDENSVYGDMGDDIKTPKRPIPSQCILTQYCTALGQFLPINNHFLMRGDRQHDCIKCAWCPCSKASRSWFVKQVPELEKFQFVCEHVYTMKIIYPISGDHLYSHLRQVEIACPFHRLAYFYYESMHRIFHKHKNAVRTRCSFGVLGQAIVLHVKNQKMRTK